MQTSLQAKLTHQFSTATYVNCSVLVRVSDLSHCVPVLLQRALPALILRSQLHNLCLQPAPLATALCRLLPAAQLTYLTLQSKQQINCSILPITVEPTFKGSIHWVSIKNEPPTHIISVYYKWIIICHLSYSRISRSCETAKIEILLQAQNIRKPCVKRKLDVL